MTTPSLPLNIYLFFILKIFSIKNQIKKEEGGVAMAFRWSQWPPVPRHSCPSLQFILHLKKPEK